MGEITLTLKEADELFPALDELANIVIPASASYRIGKIHRKLKVEISDFLDLRLDAIKRLGVKHKEKEEWSVLPKNMDEYTTEIDKLLAEEIILSGVMKIEFDDIRNIQIKPASIAMLELLINGLEE